MSANWTSGYVTDIEYTWGFYPEIGPVMLNWIAATAGYSPRSLDREFNYLELGCGNGVSVNVNGAVHPNGKFWGVDFMPQHVANGQNMADNGGLKNVKILRCGFADLLKDFADLPKFDFITLHGILTWISPENQQAIIDIINKKLEPGGIVYLSYNSYPGQALIEPVRKMMIEYTRGMQGDSKKRAQVAIGFVEKLLEVNPRAFGHGDRVKRLVEKIKKSPPNYIVHEYFHEHWYPFYFADIAKRMGAIGLTFAGSATLQRNILDLNLNEAQRKLLSPVPDVARREQIKDYMLDEQFRRDVFVRAPTVQVPRDPTKMPGLLDLRVGTMRGDKEIEREIKVPAGTVRFKREFDDKMIAKLLSGAHTVREYIDDAALAERPPLGIAQVVQLLMATRQAWPFQSEVPDVPADAGQNEDQKWEIASQWNRVIIAERIGGGNVRNIAAPVPGTALPLSMLEACLLDGVHHAGIRGAVEYANKELERRKRLLVINNKTMERGPEQTKVLEEELAAFKTEKIAKYARLGVLRAIA